MTDEIDAMCVLAWMEGGEKKTTGRGAAAVASARAWERAARS